MTKKQMQKHAEGLLAYYQKMLRLQDWDIQIQVLDNSEYLLAHGTDAHDTTGACNEIVTATKRSLISMRCEEQHGDPTENLIHELVHLMLQQEWWFVYKHMDMIHNTEQRELFKSTLDDFLELSVSNVTRALIRTLQEGGIYKQ